MHFQDFISTSNLMILQLHLQVLMLEGRPASAWQLGFFTPSKGQFGEGTDLHPGSSLQTRFSSSGQQKPDTAATMDKTLCRAKGNTLEVISAD